jgi:hypothetical protein
MASVRIFGYAGTVQLQQNLLKHFNSDSAFVRQEQYIWAQKLTLNGLAPVESVVQANDTATFVIVEVDKNTRVRYEVNPNGPAPAVTHRDASTNSPAMEGEAPFQWFKGATMSFIDAAGT